MREIISETGGRTRTSGRNTSARGGEGPAEDRCVAQLGSGAEARDHVYLLFSF